MDLREMITTLQERRAGLRTEMDTLLNAPAAEGRDGMNETEIARFDQIEAEIRELDGRVRNLSAVEARDAEAAATVTALGLTARAQVTEPPVYTRGRTGQSFFRDLYRANTKGDRDAIERLERNNRQVEEAKAAKEQRAISTGAGAGGEFVPPLWLENEFIAFVRPGRITANLCKAGEVPPGTDSINIPKINSGTATAAVSAQNTGIQQTDLTTASVSSPVQTIAGGQTVALQLIEQSPLNIDEIVLQDLAADYAKQLNTQVLSGSGSGGQVTGIFTLSGTTAVTWTQATPALGGAGGLYAKLGNAIQSIHSSRFLPPTAIIMHPRRWAWCETQSDGNGRPLVVPEAGGPFNVAGNLEAQASQGRVGQMLGLPVFVDALIPTNLGGGANQDAVIVAKMDDLWLWEGEVRAEAFAQTYAQNMSVFVRLYNYMAFQAGRYAQSIATITGTGAVAPTF